MSITVHHRQLETPGLLSAQRRNELVDALFAPPLAAEPDRPGPIRPGPCPRGPLPTTATRVDRMARTLHTKAGAAVYAARKAMVEPVFGQIKQARGFRQFLLRGFEQVQGEWSLVCTTHNILKLHRLYG
jgi:hypothetical protein